MSTNFDQEPGHVAVVRLSGDICTKAKFTRKAFQKQLRSNLKDAINQSDADYTLRLIHARFDVETSSALAAENAARVFGVHSVTPARSFAWETFDDVIALGEREFAARVSGRRFAVRCKRAGAKDLAFRSPDVERALGTKLVEAGGRVDLSNPEVTAHVEVRADRVLFWQDAIPGPGGLPLGAEGRGLALISGGFDSAVAAWSMMMRGVALDFVFFNLGGPPHLQGVINVLREFASRWAYGDRPVLHVVEFRPVVGELKTKVKGRFWQVLLKRLMLRAAQQIATEEGHAALVTGDALGQVSSQTLANLGAVSSGIDTLVLRPLVGWNKDDIINHSRVVGTHDAAVHNPEYCSLDAGKPATRVKPFELDRQQGRLDDSILAELVRSRVTTRVDRLTDVTDVDVQTRAIPEDAVVIDLRVESTRADWHYPGSIGFPYERALASATLLPKTATFVLYCEVGLKSAFLAEQLREMGWTAYSFAGGVPALRRWHARHYGGDE